MKYINFFLVAVALIGGSLPIRATATNKRKQGTKFTCGKIKGTWLG